MRRVFVDVGEGNCQVSSATAYNLASISTGPFLAHTLSFGLVLVFTGYMPRRREEGMIQEAMSRCNHRMANNMLAAEQ